MRWAFRTTSALVLALLVAVPTAPQTQTSVVVGAETVLDTFSVTLRGLPVVVTDASDASDCDFSSTTGTHIHTCYWCDSTSAWVVAGACVTATQSWTDSAASAWTDSAATEWTNP